MITSIYSEKQKITQLIRELKPIADDGPLYLQYIYSNHIVLKTGGFIENSTKAIFYNYTNRHSKPEIAKFVEHHAGRMNSLNCEKIEKFANQFDEDFWPKIKEQCDRTELEAIDSIKAIRDTIAHGKINGTGISIVIDHFNKACTFVEHMEAIIYPSD